MSAKVRAALQLVGATMRTELERALRTQTPAQLAAALAPDARQLVAPLDRADFAEMLRQLAQLIEQRC